MSNNYAYDANYPGYGYNGAPAAGAAPHPAHPHLGAAAAAALGSGAEVARVPEIQAPAGDGGGELGDASMQAVNAAATEAAAAAAAASQAASEAVTAAAGGLEEPELQQSPSSGKAASSLAVPGGGSAKKETPYSRSPELRESHKIAERKRRKEMKDLFDDLRNVLPEEKGPKTSKWEILRQAVGHFNHLKECNAVLQGEVEALRQEIQRVGGVVPEPAQMPAPPAPLARDSAAAETAQEQQAHYDAMEQHHAAHGAGHEHEHEHDEAALAAQQQQQLELEQQQLDAEAAAQQQQEMTQEEQAAAAALAAQQEANYFAAAAAAGGAGAGEVGAGEADAEGEMEAEGEVEGAEAQQEQDELQHAEQHAAVAGEEQQGQDAAMTAAEGAY